MIYAGIGSRETPSDIIDTMETIGKYLAEAGHTLRSGHAGGADMAFENGCDTVNGDKTIFLPWKGFNGSDSQFYTVSTEAMELAMQYHPAWQRLTQGGQKLMARNAYQVLGYELDTPADFIVCWTVKGQKTGGTGQALRMAADYQIPVFNLFHGTAALKAFIKK